MKDILWIDYAKIIGIFLVVYGHLLQRTGLVYEELRWVWDLIYLFHMPLFFFISGYLYKGSQNWGKILKGLVIPYLIYQLMFFPIVYIPSLVKEGFSVTILLQYFVGIILGDGYHTEFSRYVCLPCWFLICIIQLRMILNYVSMSFINSVLLVLGSIISLFVLKSCHINLYFNLDSTLMALPYFIFGYWMNKKTIQPAKVSLWGAVLLLAFSVCEIGIYMINGPTQMNGPSYGRYMILDFMGGLLGIGIVLIISNCRKSISQYLKLLARNTLFIIFFHWLFIDVASRTNFFSLWKVVDSSAFVAVIIAIYSVLILVFAIPAIRLIQGRCDIVLGK